MTTAAAMKIVMMLGACYPTPPVGEETIRAYVRVLVDFEEKLVERAVLRLVKTATFLPRIAEILAVVFEEAHGEDALPTAEEAFEILSRAVRKFGGHRPFPTTIPHAALIQRALRQIGGWSYFCQESENLVADRARFIDAFNGVLRRERDRITLGIESPRFDFKGAAELDDQARGKRLPAPATQSVADILERLEIVSASQGRDVRETVRARAADVPGGRECEATLRRVSERESTSTPCTEQS